MNLVIYNCLDFTIEFLKMYLTSIFFFRIKQKKQTGLLYVVCIVIVSVLSIFIELPKYAVVYGIMILFVLMYGAAARKRLWIFPVLYVGISVIDILNSLFVMKLFVGQHEKWKESVVASMCINAITLFWLVLGIVIIKRKKKETMHFEVYRNFWIYFFAGITICLYLTCIQVNELKGIGGVYHNMLFGGLSASAIILIILCVMFFIKNNENEKLRREKEVNQRLLYFQKEYYQMLLEKEKQTKAFRHDIRNHIFCMKSLIQEEKYDELVTYLEKMSGNIRQLSPRIQTGNALVTAIINDLIEKFPMVQCTWKGFLIEDIYLSSYDICTIFYNLFVNAFEAANQTEEKEVIIKVRFLNEAMFFTIENSYSKVAMTGKGELLSTKEEKGHGFGVRNAKEGIFANEGSYTTMIKNKRFITEIVLPAVIDDSTEKGQTVAETGHAVSSN